jgi:hypothetical protein
MHWPGDAQHGLPGAHDPAPTTPAPKKKCKKRKK